MEHVLALDKTPEWWWTDPGGHQWRAVKALPRRAWGRQRAGGGPWEAAPRRWECEMEGLHGQRPGSLKEDRGCEVVGEEKYLKAP